MVRIGVRNSLGSETLPNKHQKLELLSVTVHGQKHDFESGIEASEYTQVKKNIALSEIKLQAKLLVPFVKFFYRKRIWIRLAPILPPN